MLLAAACISISGCFGTSGCPCDNNGPVWQGCRNSTGNGAQLRWASCDTDQMKLEAHYVPRMAPALLFEGEGEQPPTPYGDGLRCVTTNVTRWGVTTDGSWSVPKHLPGDEPKPRFFQFLYRDPDGPCASGVNLSSSLTVWTD